MTFKLPDAFTLIEEGKKSTASLLNSIQCPAQKVPFLMLDHTQFGAHDGLVYHLIQALLIAQEANIPLILNRTGQAIESSTLPSTFQIGLLTSGTTGTPKVQCHTLESIMPANTKKSGQSRWLLCYHPMTFAGLQVILQAIVCGDVLLASPFSNVQHKAELALTEQCTALSATPSLTRALLLCWQTKQPSLDTITCGGELCDQSLLNLLHTTFPQAKIRHIYATTETGVLFAVNDGKEGFPLAYLNQEHHGWTLSIQAKQLIATKNGLVIATGDIVEVGDDRVLFNGRLDNSANVGGVKVNLDSLEQDVLHLPSISNARVFAKASPITGAIVCVEIETKDEAKAREEINELNKQLNPAEQLRVVRFVTEITLSDTGKKQRVLTS
jgi:acyl-coenzyme A synthetase/AMP-(fatty) acid ligase